MAENRKRGDVGTKQRKAQATKDMSYIEAENQKAQNEQRAAIAQSNRDLEMIRWVLPAHLHIMSSIAWKEKEEPCALWTNMHVHPSLQSLATTHAADIGFGMSKLDRKVTDAVCVSLTAGAQDRVREGDQPQA